MGILGGTFNPPHNGHLELARDALVELALDEVMLVPSHTPPHKPTPSDTAAPAERLAMCRLAVEGVDRVSICDLEVRRGGSSYTVDTLSEVHDAEPEAKLTLIMGADVAQTLPSWRHPGALMQLAQIAIAQRDGSASQEAVTGLIESIESRGGRAAALRMPPIDVSSSLVRERVAAGERIDRLVAPAVARYIAERRLYSKGTAT